MNKYVTVGLLAIVALIYTGCFAAPAVEVGESKWRTKIESRMMNAGDYVPKPGNSFLIVGTKLDFGGAAEFVTEKLNIIGSNGKRYAASGGCAAFSMPGAIDMGNHKIKLDNGKIACQFVFIVPNSEKADQYRLNYGFGGTGPFSVN